MATTELPSWLPRQRTEFLIDAVGGVNALARLLDVSPSQPSRWRKGEEAPGPETARRLLDLDHVVARVLLLWDRSLVEAWLTGANAHLDGRRPIDVLRLRGAPEVLAALDAEAQGAFA